MSVIGVLAGIGVLMLAAGFVLMLLGTSKDGPMFAIGTTLVCTPLVGALVVLGISLITGLNTGPRYVENECYRAVRRTTMTLIPAGKVLIPTTTSGIYLEVIRCPS